MFDFSKILNKFLYLKWGCSASFQQID